MPVLRRITDWARAHRWRYGAVILALLSAQLFVAYDRLTSTTEVSTANALDEFRRRQQQVTATDSEQPAVVAGTPGQTNPLQPSTGSTPTRAGAANSSIVDPACEWVCATDFTAPEAGVYNWFQCGRDSGQCSGGGAEPTGSESFGGLSRPLPRTGRRSIIVNEPTRWTNYHQYAEEHKEEFELFVDSSGVFGERYKVEITIGPGSGGSDIRQSPPARFAQFPAYVGLTWSGHWEDRNGNSDADYTGKVIDKQEITVGGTKIRTWVVEMNMKLLGPKSRGDVLVRLWVSPELRQTIQEYYDQSITDEQGIPYNGKWMLTLANAKPNK